MSTPRPRWVTVAGILSWLTGVIALAAGVGILVAGLSMQPGGTQALATVNGPWEPSYLMVRYSAPLSIFYVAYAACLITVGRGLLALRTWARGVLEAAAWLTLLVTVGYGVVFTRGGAAEVGHSPGAPAFLFRPAFTIGMVAGQALLLCVLIIFLRGRAARAAFDEQQVSSKAT